MVSAMQKKTFDIICIYAYIYTYIYICMHMYMCNMYIYIYTICICMYIIYTYTADFTHSRLWVIQLACKTVTLSQVMNAFPASRLKQVRLVSLWCLTVLAWVVGLEQSFNLPMNRLCNNVINVIPTFWYTYIAMYPCSSFMLYPYIALISSIYYIPLY
jgi:hypothetical protein